MWVMKRGVAIALMLAGCLDIDDGGPVDPVDPVDPPPSELPVGIWEPLPGASVWDASLAADGETIWWAVTHEISPAGESLMDDQVWMTATTTSGASVVPPSAIAPEVNADFSPGVVVTSSAVIVKSEGVRDLLARFDRAGTPLGAPYDVVIQDGARVIDQTGTTEIIATLDGGMRYVATLQGDTYEVAIVDFDPAGVKQTTRFAGTPDQTEGGTQPGTISAAVRSDGSTLLAWERGWNGCISTRGSETLTTTLDSGGVGTIQPVRDLAGSEYRPVVAASGDTAYAAWVSESGNGAIALARYPDVTTVIAELGGTDQWVAELELVLAAPDRGVISWRTGFEGTLHMMPFDIVDGVVMFGAERTLPLVDPEAGAYSAGLVHIADNRYVLGWIEGRWVGIEQRTRLYAAEINFTRNTMRPAPPVEKRPPLPPRKAYCP